MQLPKNSDLARIDQWTKPLATKACGSAYRSYEAEVKQHYRNYFADHPELGAADHDYSAASLGKALPATGTDLKGKVAPPKSLHRYFASGRSSQVLALGLLGVAEDQDPSLRWLWDALGLEGIPEPEIKTEFEYDVGPNLLDEGGRNTSVWT